MTRIRLRPRGMVAWLALVFLAALAVEFAGNLFINDLQEREILSEEQFRHMAGQLASADRIASNAQPAMRAGLMRDMSVQGMALNWVPGTVITDSSAAHPQLRELRQRLVKAEPHLSGRDLRLNLIPSDRAGKRDLLGALRLADGSFVTYRVRQFLGSPPSFAMTTLLHLLLVGAVICVALLMMIAVVRPLGVLADAADATGRGKLPDIEVRGPAEVRRVATAFRAMQARLLQMVDDHTEALVAVSHDLRTPIQRLRLRLAQLPDNETTEAMAADIEDMERFLSSVAGFMQSGTSEEARLVDLAALAMTIVDNAADAGHAIEYDGPDALPAMVPPLAVKRTLGNLVDNACRHGEAVRVSLRSGDPVLLSVEDDGPGIPAEQRETAFLPFRRLDRARQRDSGGSGLGLAIVRKAVESFHGEVSLERSALGGLAARVAIPLAESR